MDRFSLAWEQLKRLEGEGKQDSSGYWTERWGIEARHWKAYFPSWPPTEEQARGFYEHVWRDLQISSLPFGLGEEYFYFAVNASLLTFSSERNLARFFSRTAPRKLQLALAALGQSEKVKIDGVLGPITIAAARRAAADDLITSFRALLVEYYYEIANGESPKFNGWLRRLGL